MGSERKLTLRSVEKSTESTTTFPCDPSGPVVDPVLCPYVNMSSFFAGNTAIQFNLGYYPNGGLRMMLDTTFLWAKAVKDTGIVELQQDYRAKFNKSQFYPSFALNGTTYANVQVITRDTAIDQTKNIYKILLAEKIGILCFEEYPSRELWVKQQ
jgi:hypothetical protein